MMFEGYSNSNNYASINIIDIISLLIGLQNLGLNITAKDLDKQSDLILTQIHSHLTKQDRYFKEQDQHLLQQDLQLEIQEKRLDRIEKIVEKLIWLQEDRNGQQI